MRFKIGLSYDKVEYRKKYTLVDTSDKMQIGGMAGIAVRPLENLELDFMYNKKVIYDSYRGSLKWRTPKLSSYGFEVGAYIDHVVSHTNIPNNTVYGASLTFLWGDNKTTQN